jgi:hypothetical protein
LCHRRSNSNIISQNQNQTKPQQQQQQEQQQQQQMIDTATNQKKPFLWNRALKAARARIEPHRYTVRTNSIDSLSSAEIRTYDTVVGGCKYYDNDVTSTASTNRSLEKRVRFHVDEEDEIVAHVIVFTTHSNESALFWSSHERQEFVVNLMNDAANAKIHHATQIAHLKDLYVNALHRDVTSDETKQGIRAIMQWSSSSNDDDDSPYDNTNCCRGLERLVLQNASKNATRRCIRNVLRAQLALSTTPTSYSEAAKQLRQHSRKCSRMTEEFAFLLALGDSAE